MTFLNPMARITIGAGPKHPPMPVDLDQLRQELNSSETRRAALAALIAFHACHPAKCGCCT